MIGALCLAKSRLVIGLDREPLILELLPADPWIANSLLQKLHDGIFSSTKLSSDSPPDSGKHQPNI